MIRAVHFSTTFSKLNPHSAKQPGFKRDFFEDDFTYDSFYTKGNNTIEKVLADYYAQQLNNLRSCIDYRQDEANSIYQEAVKTIEEKLSKDKYPISRLNALSEKMDKASTQAQKEALFFEAETLYQEYFLDKAEDKHSQKLLMETKEYTEYQAEKIHKKINSIDTTADKMAYVMPVHIQKAAEQLSIPTSQYRQQLRDISLTAIRANNQDERVREFFEKAKNLYIKKTNAVYNAAYGIMKKMHAQYRQADYSPVQRKNTFLYLDGFSDPISLN